MNFSAWPALSFLSTGVALGESDGLAVSDGDADGDSAGDCDGDCEADGLLDGLFLFLSATRPNAGRFFELGLSDAFLDGLSDGSEDGEDDGEDDGESLGASGSLTVGALPAPHGPGAVLLQATVRKRSCAVRDTVSTRSERFLPGISTTMNRSPWTVTSASLTPVPLTRWSMILRASSIDSLSGLP